MLKQFPIFFQFQHFLNVMNPEVSVERYVDIESINKIILALSNIISPYFSSKILDSGIANFAER
ncbi:hypothetical protein D9M71_06430 [compost metagenome]